MIRFSQKGDVMQDFEDDEFFENDADDSISIDDDEDGEDPKMDAFMRGVEEAEEIEEQKEEDDDFL
jgi:hypothetical protein